MDVPYFSNYLYNAKGQRVKKVGNSGITIYHYDLQGKLIEETDGFGNLIADYVYAGSNRIAMVTPGNSVYYYHNDHLGTPLAMTDRSGTVVWAAYYKPYGEAVIQTETVKNNFRFPGQYYDEETGLHYNNHRYYDPATGRYLTPDPILSNFLHKNKFYFVVPLFKLSPSRLIPYIYVRNNPIKGIDPEGTDEPGCDRIPDILETRCKRNCCDIHDNCFAREKCSEKSWKDWACGKKDPCTKCDQDVWDCFTKCSNNELPIEIITW